MRRRALTSSDPAYRRDGANHYYCPIVHDLLVRMREKERHAGGERQHDPAKNPELASILLLGVPSLLPVGYDLVSLLVANVKAEIDVFVVGATVYSANSRLMTPASDVPLSLHECQEGFLPLIVGIVLAIVLSFIIRETGVGHPPSETEYSRWVKRHAWIG
jgi:hypothetical protein